MHSVGPSPLDVGASIDIRPAEDASHLGPENDGDRAIEDLDTWQEPALIPNR
jgi:hypothetical protein